MPSGCFVWIKAPRGRRKESWRLAVKIVDKKKQSHECRTTREWEKLLLGDGFIILFVARCRHFVKWTKKSKTKNLADANLTKSNLFRWEKAISESQYWIRRQVYGVIMCRAEHFTWEISIAKHLLQCIVFPLPLCSTTYSFQLGDTCTSHLSMSLSLSLLFQSDKRHVCDALPAH